MLKSLVLFTVAIGSIAVVHAQNPEPIELTPLPPISPPNENPTTAPEVASSLLNQSSPVLSTPSATGESVVKVTSTAVEGDKANSTLSVDSSTPVPEKTKTSTSSTASPEPSSEARMEQAGFGAALLAGVVMGLAFL